MEWKPIDEISRNGREFLIFCPAIDGYDCHVARWDGDRWCGSTGEGIESWVEWPPSHYMPLPNPPTEVYLRPLRK